MWEEGKYQEVWEVEGRFLFNPKLIHFEIELTHEAKFEARLPNMLAEMSGTDDFRISESQDCLVKGSADATAATVDTGKQQQLLLLHEQQAQFSPAVRFPRASSPQGTGRSMPVSAKWRRCRGSNRK